MRRLLTLFALVTVSLAVSLTVDSRVQTSDISARSAVQPDTLFQTVQAGEPLIVQLPEAFQGQPVEYRVIQAPALSWLVDRSFYWRTLPSERGTLPVLIERTVRGLPSDTLVLMVEIRR
ncbi:MAG: hypothetical protein R3284_10895 [Rubricoccaceae bacterium]|nr:hypothetical protein [Rubricoccaceae bacterium]